MNRVITTAVWLFISIVVIPQSVSSQEAVCEEVYTEGIGWTHTFGMGRCPGSSDTEELTDLAVGVLVGAGVLWMMGGFETGENSSYGWTLNEPRDSLLGFPIAFRHRNGTFKLLQLETTKETGQHFVDRVGNTNGYRINLLSVNFSDW